MYNELMELIFLFIVGACVGSFLGALTWRWPREIAISDGRSKCPHCGHEIRAHHNIPIVSYIVLHGKCYDCKKPIPRRDFTIETTTAFLFPLISLLSERIFSNLSWLNQMPIYFALTVLFVVLSICIAIFVIDLEHQYIPDTLVFVMLAILIGSFLLTDNSLIFKYLLTAFGAAIFLLGIHLVTLGRGMGLGDVKLALAIGMVLGFPLSLVWMFSSFILGFMVGIILIVLKLAKLKQKIAFGPFLIVGFLLTVIFGFEILNTFYLIY